MFKIHSITVVIKSLIEKNNRFYLELPLNHCLYKLQSNDFTYSARLVNILDFNPKKLSIEKVCAINDELERIYYVKYDGDPFYLVIDDLKSYFKYSKEKELKFIIEDRKKKKNL